MSVDNAYRSPDADLESVTERARSIRTLYDSQNGILGVVAGAAVSLLMSILWSEATISDKYISPVFLVLSGVLIGGAVRYGGNAVSVSLRYVAAFLFLVCCYLALIVMEVPMVARLSGPMLAILLLLVAGGVAAYRIARRSLTDDQKASVWRQESAPEVFKKRLRNRAWVIWVTAVLSALVIFNLAILWRIRDIL